jgi:hypothetical protein
MKAIAIVAGLIVAATAAAAASKWTAAGWYQVADDFVDAWIHAGPFGDKASCDATRPPNDKDADYYCVYLDSKPSWDD